MLKQVNVYQSGPWSHFDISLVSPQKNPLNQAVFLNLWIAESFAEEHGTFILNVGNSDTERAINTYQVLIPVLTSSRIWIFKFHCCGIPIIFKSAITSLNLLNAVSLHDTLLLRRFAIICNRLFFDSG